MPSSTRTFPLFRRSETLRLEQPLQLCPIVPVSAARLESPAERICPSALCGWSNQTRLGIVAGPILGLIGPFMGINIIARKPAMHLTATGDALFTKTQQRVLGLLFGAPGRRFYTNEIVRLANMGRGTITRELDRLEAVGAIMSTREGNQRYYQVNPACPVYPEILGIVRKTSGIDGIIADALESWKERILLAFVYGAIANGRENVGSPIDLFIVAEQLAYGDVMLALNEAARIAGRPVNPSIYSRQQLRRELARHNTFINRVLRHPKLWVLGTENDLRTIRESASG